MTRGEDRVMCKSLREGGQRCAADTRMPAIEALDDLAGRVDDPDLTATDEQLEAIEAYASTSEGQRTISKMVGMVEQGLAEAELPRTPGTEAYLALIDRSLQRGLERREMATALGDAYDLEVLRTEGALAYAERLTLADARRHAQQLGVDLTPTLTQFSQDDVDGSVVPRYLDERVDTIHAGDALIMTDFKDGKGPCLLMIKRMKAPFNGGYALPGGKMDAGETMSDTIDREMEEEVHVTPDKALRTHTLGDDVYSDTWDPRYPHAHVGAKVFEVTPDLAFQADDDAAGAEWVPIADLTSGKETLAFGHANWLARMYEPGSPFADERMSQKFALLAVAARERHKKIAKKVNAVRAEGGYTLLPV